MCTYGLATRTHPRPCTRLPLPPCRRPSRRVGPKNSCQRDRIAVVHRAHHRLEALAIGPCFEAAQDFNGNKIRLEKEEEARREAERLQAMTETRLRSLDRLHGDIPDAFDDNDDYEQDILHGRAAADISHAGEVLPADDADAAVMAGDFGGATRTPHAEESHAATSGRVQCPTGPP
ncbi:hypothetical protein B0H14DRAFT_2624689 [Mycena olivaceomarginata]|nr:hypothetical protein B0H14DRAFT_2624689 [Mycena olivaceomarginata]